MDFNDFQQGTDRTNLYSKAISDFLLPIQCAVYNLDPSAQLAAISRLDELETMLNIVYTMLGYAGELGESMNALKKVIRGDRDISEFIDLSFAEQGDALYYASELAAQTGYKLEDIAKGNNRKLRDRMDRGVIKGDGDHR